MKNRRSTKNALMTSVIAVILCFAMFVGITFAWFSDTVYSGSGVIKAGDLNVDLIHAHYEGNTGSAVEKVSLKDEPNHKVFKEVVWEPGQTQIEYLQIMNEGNLHVAYEVRLLPSGEVSKLANVIEVYWSYPSVAYDKNAEEALGYMNYLGTLAEVLAKGGKVAEGNDSGVIEPDGTSRPILAMAIALHMKKDASADYQGMNLCEGDGIRICLEARQWTDESDGFGSDYDEDAEWPMSTWDGTADVSWYDGKEDEQEYTITTAGQFAGLAKLVNEQKVSFTGKTVKLGASIDLNNLIWTPIGQTGATTFAGTFDGQGNTIYNLKTVSTNTTSTSYATGLFGWIECHDPFATIKNVKVDGADITGHKYTGVIVGWCNGLSITNCTVTNASVKCTYTDSLCGDKAGVIVGYALNQHRVTISGNTVKDCTVTACRDAGQVAGASYTDYVTGNTIENVVVSGLENNACTDEDKATNIRNEEIGRVLN